MRPPFSPMKSSSIHHRLSLFASFVAFRWVHMKPTITTTATDDDGDGNGDGDANTCCRHRKIIVIMGATGAGKSRLSIDLATRFFKNSEIINSDKMQVYRGLDITTNKIRIHERKNVPHHLLGAIDPVQSVIDRHEFRILASNTISDILSRRGLPVLVGGSNSFIYSLLTKRFNPQSENVFNRTHPNPNPNPMSSELRFRCCFIWVDVGFRVLNSYLSKRVDEMLESGMLEELSDFFGSGEYLTVKRSGLGQAIGVPEMEGYFTAGDGVNSDEMYCKAVRRIKENTCELAKRQVGKIVRLKEEGGWDLKRIDATEVFRTMMEAETGGGTVAELWEKEVVETSVKIVEEFLEE